MSEEIYIVVEWGLTVFAIILFLSVIKEGWRG